MSRELDSTFTQSVSVDLARLAYNSIADGNLQPLHVVGLDESSIKCISVLKNTDNRLVELAFQQALSVQIYVDPVIFKRVLVSNKKLFEKEHLLEQFVLNGAGLEMVRYFFPQHSNRQHTELRQKLDVVDFEVKNNKVKVTSKDADDFFKKTWVSNKKINAKDVLKFATENNYLISSVWRELKIFIECGK